MLTCSTACLKPAHKFKSPVGQAVLVLPRTRIRLGESAARSQGSGGSKEVFFWSMIVQYIFINVYNILYSIHMSLNRRERISRPVGMSSGHKREGERTAFMMPQRITIMMMLVLHKHASSSDCCFLLNYFSERMTLGIFFLRNRLCSKTCHMKGRV